MSGTRFEVSIGPGVYAPLHLHPQDSGVPGAPVVYAGRRASGLHDGGAPPLISGGVHLPASAFTAWTGHPGAVQADLSALPLDYGEMGAGGGNSGNCTQVRMAPRSSQNLANFSLL